MEDRQLRNALKANQVVKGPWGVSYAAEVEGSRVFVKRVPMTEREAARPWSTRNHFRLPAQYNYGFGSAGFGAHRELIGHITTTTCVLEGSTPGFPLLLHHRLMERTPTGRPELAGIERYVRRWNSRAVGEFMTARAAAPLELWLVMEHIPHPMSDWLMGNQDRVENVIDQLFAAISVLGTEGIVHFDVHFANVLTDGETVHLADFGLLNDSRFELTKSELKFLQRHRHYDYASAILAIGLAPRWRVWAEPAASRTALVSGYPWLQGLERSRDFAAAMIDHASQMTTGPLAVTPVYAETLRRYREVILYMSGFHDDMWENPRKRSPYDDDHVQRILREAGAPT
ncbi:MAG TPA: hypothetical protein VMY88_08590 [Acidimicrobiales bacterium]|nr:hypothetical protein [Acidimicrobiales bacterium]